MESNHPANKQRNIIDRNPVGQLFISGSSSLILGLAWKLNMSN
jgi:hypothetical protein